MADLFDNLHVGDLFGSGTLSGPKPEQGGSLMELSSGGKRPLTGQRRYPQLPGGQLLRDPARLLPARGLQAHQLRRVLRHLAAGRQGLMGAVSTMYRHFPSRRPPTLADCCLVPRA